MPVHVGRNYVAIPGPTVVPDQVLNAMHRMAPNIYASELSDMVGEIIEDLKTVARTRNHVAIYVANGHGAWEAALSNMASRGDKILILSTGFFSNRWGEMADAMGIIVEHLVFDYNQGVDPERVADRLKNDTDNHIKAVLSVHVDTATSARNEIFPVTRAIRATGHPALFAVDCIASLACEPFEMDEWEVDVVVAGTQKGLMTPPGLGFVYVSDRARRQCEHCDLRTKYWDWNGRIDPKVFYEYFCGTAPTHHLFGLREALDMILRQEGFDAVIARHEKIAKTVWAATDAWSATGPINFNIANPEMRSHSVTTIRIGNPDGLRLRTWTEENAGVTLGIGLGMATPDDPNSDAYFRIGHMGHLNAHMVLGVLSVIDSGLKSLNIAHGKGALEAAAGVVAANWRD